MSCICVCIFGNTSCGCLLLTCIRSMHDVCTVSKMFGKIFATIKFFSQKRYENISRQHILHKYFSGKYLGNIEYKQVFCVIGDNGSTYVSLVLAGSLIHKINSSCHWSPCFFVYMVSLNAASNNTFTCTSCTSISLLFNYHFRLWTCFVHHMVCLNNVHH